MRMRWLPLLCLAALVGCTSTTTREFTLRAEPQDAMLKINGIDRGRGPITEEFLFHGPDEIHRVTASRPGYKDQVAELRRDRIETDVLIELKPLTRDVTINVEPHPAIIRIDGKPVTAEPVSSVTRELVFTLDETNHWTKYTVSAERPGWQKVEREITWTDPDNKYLLPLRPLEKTMNVTSEPSGAQVYLDDQSLGVTPVKADAVQFAFDEQGQAFVPRALRVAKPGYDPVTATIGWDEGQTDYHIDLQARHKTVRVPTNPVGAAVTIDGEEIKQRDESGAPIVELDFPPVNETGELKTYTAVVSKPPTEDEEWHPQQIMIGWDDGKTDYPVTLKEVLTKQVPLVQLSMERVEGAWRPVPQRLTTLAMKDPAEGAFGSQPVRITELPGGTMIDTFAVSPDGDTLVLSVPVSDGSEDFRSQLLKVRTEGQAPAEMLTDDRNLYATPAFTPDGRQIAFATNRGGSRLSIWSMSAGGAPGVTQITGSENHDLFPVIDSDPKPRMYYQVHIDSRPEPRIYSTQLGATGRTDLVPGGGSQPRVSPKADSVVFVAPHEKTGKRDLYRIGAGGGMPINLTNTPDVDEFDPSWSPDGRRLAFASDRGVDQEKRRNHDIWLLDVTDPSRPTQLTTNGSWDDRPEWSPAGDAIYFRSNRGGEWNVWRASVE